MTGRMKSESTRGKERRRIPPDLDGDDRVFLAWHRSHLANERTFLAWCRTSIALIVFGFVIDRLEPAQVPPLLGSTPVHEMAYLALFSFLLAAGAILISGFRFLLVRRHINSGEAVFSVMPDILVIIAVIIVVSFAIALSIRRMELMYWPFP